MDRIEVDFKALDTLIKGTSQVALGFIITGLDRKLNDVELDYFEEGFKNQVEAIKILSEDRRRAEQKNNP